MSIVLSLEREGTERCEAKAIGSSRLILEYKFVCTMLLLCDVLPHITHLSKCCFQIEAVDYSVIPTMLSSTISSLQQLITCDGSNFSSLQSYLQKLEQANVTVTKQANLGENYFLESIRKPFLRCLIDNLEKGLKINLYLLPLMYLILRRFPNFQMIPQILNQIVIHQPRKVSCSMEIFT